MALSDVLARLSAEDKMTILVDIAILPTIEERQNTSTRMSRVTSCVPAGSLGSPTRRLKLPSRSSSRLVGADEGVSGSPYSGRRGLGLSSRSTIHQRWPW